ncbi:MAG: hypothetical protein FWG91_00670 [Lachnospiraceae bacterium]|nr:hypothetical protein [Lachnospiraceae bacterium]
MIKLPKSLMAMLKRKEEIHMKKPSIKKVKKAAQTAMGNNCNNCITIK